ncbi:MAG: non-hydrolyzing UDP-N-acetylglucosamine 2-epimerase [Planctomycetota bacterium]|jgi:UDP-N-acetylglucosamine 2-epimerase (non-hydrolysing)
MKKTSVIFGTRPEAIKLCPLVLAMRRRADLGVEVCVTGQHRQMLDQVLDVFGVTPDADLDLMRPDQSLAGLTARAVEAVDRYLADSRPDAVIVQGDTTTVFSAALAAFYRDIPVGHVEAGLRTGDPRRPFPEEMNRVMTGRLARWHFAPTVSAGQNLLSEGVDPDSVFITGNTVIDALEQVLPRVRQNPPAIAGLDPALVTEDRDRPLVLITGHRRENHGAGVDAICDAIAQLAARFTETAFVYPVHLNPKVCGPVRERLGDLPNVQLIEPLGYEAFVALMDRSTLVLTDSGGVQEEAPSLGKPVLVMRQTTERPEAVRAGAVRLVGADTERIVGGVTELLTDTAAYRRMARAVNPYGDGRACRRIIAALVGEPVDPFSAVPFMKDVA